MKIIFFGSDDFARVHLEHLLTHGHQVLCCVTGPDKPQGRGMKIVISPIKELDNFLLVNSVTFCFDMLIFNFASGEHFFPMLALEILLL